MTFKKFIHAGVILVTTFAVAKADAAGLTAFSERLAEAAKAALAHKSADDPLRVELGWVASRKAPYGRFSKNLSTRAQLAILPFLTFEDLLALIELETSTLKAFHVREAMSLQSEELLLHDLTRVQAIAMYAIDQVETRTQWRQAATLISNLRFLLKGIGRREVYAWTTVPTQAQRNADTLINLGRLQGNPGLIVIGMASRGFSSGRAMENVRLVDAEKTSEMRSQILNLRSMLETRLYFVGNDLEVTRMDRLRVGVSSICERLLF